MRPLGTKDPPRRVRWKKSERRQSTEREAIEENVKSTRGKLELGLAGISSQIANIGADGNIATRRQETRSARAGQEQATVKYMLKQHDHSINRIAFYLALPLQ